MPNVQRVLEIVDALIQYVHHLADRKVFGTG
jgi:hypothetical protein